jgi:hypothetical protein
MPSASRHRAALLAAIAVILVLGVPATAMFVRLMVHFAASFDVTGAPGGGLQADVGQISVVAPPTEFVVVPTTGGGGELKIHDGGTTVEATLVGTFKTLFKGQQLDATWSMGASQADSPFDVRFVDDSDSGMIDVGFGGNGSIVVGGQPVMPYTPGTDYEVELTLYTPLFGSATWSVLVTEAGGTISATATGSLPSATQYGIKSVHLVRPAGAPAGDFVVDDLKVVSSTPSFK